MRKWRFTRPVRSGKSMVMLALLITVLVHAVFLLVGYHTPSVKTGETGTGVQTLNIKNLPAGEQKNLMNWISLHDPLKIAGSSSSAGYTALHKPQTRFQVEVKPFKIREIRYESNVSAFSPLPLLRRTGALPPEPENNMPEIAVKSVIKVIDQNGNELKNFLKHIPAYTGYAAPTVVQIKRFGRLSSVFLLSSSGNAELDRAAAAAASRYETQDQNTVTVIWPPAEEKKK